MIVKIHSGGVGAPPALRQHARPGNGEAIGAQAQVSHPGHVLAPAVIVVTGNVARAAICNPAGRVRKAVPDGLTFAVLVPGAFYLIGRGRRAPHEIGRERSTRCHHQLSTPLTITSVCSSGGKGITSPSTGWPSTSSAIRLPGPARSTLM